MLDIQIRGGSESAALAELIAATLHGNIILDPHSSVATAGRLVREHQELAELARPSMDTFETINFTKVDDETDWTDV